MKNLHAFLFTTDTGISTDFWRFTAMTLLLNIFFPFATAFKMIHDGIFELFDSQIFLFHHQLKLWKFLLHLKNLLGLDIFAFIMMKTVCAFFLRMWILWWNICELLICHCSGLIDSLLVLLGWCWRWIVLMLILRYFRGETKVDVMVLDLVVSL